MLRKIKPSNIDKTKIYTYHNRIEQPQNPWGTRQYLWHRDLPYQSRIMTLELLCQMNHSELKFANRQRMYTRQCSILQIRLEIGN